jgi:hypothetical protein
MDQKQLSYRYGSELNYRDEPSYEQASGTGIMLYPGGHFDNLTDLTGDRTERGNNVVE